jgi:hypothetical protein
MGPRPQPRKCKTVIISEEIEEDASQQDASHDIYHRAVKTMSDVSTRNVKGDEEVRKDMLTRNSTRGAGR